MSADSTDCSSHLHHEGRGAAGFEHPYNGLCCEQFSTTPQCDVVRSTDLHVLLVPSVHHCLEAFQLAFHSAWIHRTHSQYIHTHTQQLMLQCEASLTLCARYVSNRVIAHPYHVIMSQARQASLLSTEGRPFSFLSSFLHLSLRAPGFTNPLELLFITE